MIENTVRPGSERHSIAPPWPANDAIAIAGGLLLYALFLWRGHAWLIGVSPLG